MRASADQSVVRRFLGWRDYFLSPPIQSIPVVIAAFAAGALRRSFSLDWVAVAGAFYASLVAVAFLQLAAMRRWWPLAPGRYSRSAHPASYHRWCAYSYLCITHLAPFYQTGLLPPVPSLFFPFTRKLFYQLLGARFGRHTLIVGGRITDAHLVTIGEGVILGDESLLLPHAITLRDGDEWLFLEPIVIGDGAIVGARSTLMPGVSVGKGALIKAGSLVRARTRIGDNEIWGGVPALYVGPVDATA